MKLHELGAQRPTEQAATVLESQGGRRIDFATIGPRRAKGMLDQVQRLITEHRRSPDFHRSQQDPAYLQLVIMEQALTARLKEQQPMPSASTPQTGSQASPATQDPKARAVMDKVRRKQPLTPEEQQTVNLVALTKEGRRSQRMVREQSELQQAQVVLAAQDMIDRLQGMLEDISEMQFKDLPALADSIKNDMGVEQSTQFQAAASAAMTTLLQALQAGKTEMESAQGILTGQAPQVPGQGAMPGAMPDLEPGSEPSGDIESDLDLDVNLPPEEPESEAPAAALGRERR
jgi:hypothetical protein